MRLLIPALLLAAALAHVEAGQPGPEDQLVTLEEGQIYRKINGETITGAEVMDLMLEEDWDKNLQAFIDHALLAVEIEAGQVQVTDAEVDAELQAMVNFYARKVNLRPEEVKIENLAREMAGGMNSLRRQTKVNLGMLRVLHKEGELKTAQHTWDMGFKEAVARRVEVAMKQHGVERDPKRLGGGEAVRIGVRACSHDEVRRFMADQLAQITKGELKQRLDILSLDKLVKRALKDKNLKLEEDDVNFHFSYLCRLKEQETGLPGRELLQQELLQRGMTAAQFCADRRFRCDAGITRLVRETVAVREPDGTFAPDIQKLQAEFNGRPELYKRVENLVSHIFIQVLDPLKKPYGPNWEATGHPAVNAYVKRVREEQFAAAKPQIEGLVALARENFEEAARKYSHDKQTAASPVAGTIGRIGAHTILAGLFDDSIRDLALKLKPGEMSPPVRSVYGWHLLKCLEKQDVTFDEAMPRVYLNLLHEGRKQTEKTLSGGAKIEDKYTLAAPAPVPNTQENGQSGRAATAPAAPSGSSGPSAGSPALSASWTIVLALLALGAVLMILFSRRQALRGPP